MNMERYRIDNGNIFFLFANSDDIYFLDSLMGLNLKQYLWYELKKSGYENVFFFSGINENYEAELLDEKSFRSYEKYGQEKFSFKKIIGGEKEFTKAEKLMVNDQQSLLKKIDDILCKNEKHKAVIMQLDTFCELYEKEENKEYYNALIKQGQVQNRENNRNILLLVSTVRAQTSKDLLLKDFWKREDEKGNVLCRELCGVLDSLKQPLYESMKLSMGERVVYLHSFSEKQIENLVKRISLEQTERFYSDKEIRNTVKFLFHWLHNKEFRRATESEKLFSDNPYRKYSILYNDLKNLRTWGQLQRLIQSLESCPEVYRESREYLQRKIGRNIEGGYANIQRNDEISIKARSLAEVLPGYLVKEWTQTYNVPQDDKTVKMLLLWMGALENANRQKDQFSMDHILSALRWFSVYEKELDRRVRDEICSCHSYIINISQSLYNKNCSAREMTEELFEKQLYLEELKKDPAMKDFYNKEWDKYKVLETQWVKDTMDIKSKEEVIQLQEIKIKKCTDNSQEEGIIGQIEQMKDNLKTMDAEIQKGKDGQEKIQDLLKNEWGQKEDYDRMMEENPKLREERLRLLNEYRQKNSLF